MTKILGFWEDDVQFFFTVVSNLSAVPTIIHAFKTQRFANAVIFISTLFISIMYHVAELWSTRLWGMTAGQWHRLDNVFAILSFQALFIYFADFKKPRAEDLVRWMSLSLALLCQEKAPWVVHYTVAPILFTVVCMLLKWAFTRQLPKLDRTNTTIGFVLMLPALYFFVVGLEDNRDWLRMNHNFWHLFAGLSSYWLYRSKDEVDPFHFKVN